MDDLIRRQAAIDAVIERDANCGIDSAEVLKTLPSAQPDKDINVPCTDTISRQDAIDAICTWDKFGVDERGRIVRWHEGLEPYVHLRDVVTAIVNLPSAEPERKTGKWEEIDIKDYKAKCSSCGTWSPTMPIMGKYCPRCGAYMKGEEDE